MPDPATVKALAWGQPTIKYCKSVNGAPEGTTWKDMPTPKEDTTKLEPKSGKELKVEGGDVIAVQSNAELSFELFVLSLKDIPFNDVDGYVEEQYAFKVLPENPKAMGILIEASRVRLEKTYTASEGIICKVIVSPSKPKTLPKVKFLEGVTGNTETR